MQLNRFSHSPCSFFWALIISADNGIGREGVIGTGFGIGTVISKGTGMGAGVNLFLEAADNISSAHMGL